MKYTSASGNLTINGKDSEFDVTPDGSVHIIARFPAFENAVGWLQQLELLTQPAMSAAPAPVEPPPAPKAKPQKKVEPEIVTYTPVPEPVVEPTVTPTVTWNDAPEPEPETEPFADFSPVAVVEEPPKQEPAPVEKAEVQATAPTTDAPKRRGRPPGSKNKANIEASASSPSEVDTEIEPSAKSRRLVDSGDFVIATSGPLGKAKLAPPTPLILRRVLKLNETTFPVEITPTELGWIATCPQLPDVQGMGTTDAEAMADIRAAISDWHMAVQKAAEKAAKGQGPVEVVIPPKEERKKIHATPEEAKAEPVVADTLADLGEECVKCQSPGEAVRLALFFHFDQNPQIFKYTEQKLLEYATAYMTNVWPRIPALTGKQIRSPDKQMYLARTYLEQYIRVKNGKPAVGPEED